MPIFEYISNNQLLSSLFATTIIGIIAFSWTYWKNFRDSKKIYEFLLQSKSNTDFTFRSTQAISSKTKITESRVRELCSKHPYIKRNEKEKQSWRIAQ
jgi:hypothetical protein